MSKSIRLDPKHGLNPTLGVCFWCGGDDGTIGLMGYRAGEEAPRKSVLSYEPCDACKAHRAEGIFFAEAIEPDRASGTAGGPTGRWCVLKEEAVRNFVQPPELLAHVLEHRMAYVEPDAWAKLFGHLEPASEVCDA